MTMSNNIITAIPNIINAVCSTFFMIGLLGSYLLSNPTKTPPFSA